MPSWLLWASASALFAGLTTILSKVGIRDINSHLATAVRTCVVLLAAWAMVLVTGGLGGLAAIDRRSLLFLALSGLATGGSWLCYYRALQLGWVSRVVAIDKCSTVLTMLLAFLFLGESLTGRSVLAMALLLAGALLMSIHRIRLQPPVTAPVLSAPDEEAEEAALLASVASSPAQPPVTAPQSPAAGREEAADDQEPAGAGPWLLFAVGAAVFASLTSILGKVGIRDINSNLGTAVRTVFVLVCAWGMVFLQGKQRELRGIGRKNWLFLVLSGLATGLSWLCFYRALQLGDASRVVPVDKLSIVVTVLFSRFALREAVPGQSWLGLAMMVAGTFLLL